MNYPAILTVEPFDKMRTDFIEGARDYLTERIGLVQATAMIEGAYSTNSALAVWTDYTILWRQSEVRKDNYKALQFFSETVTESDMVDLVVSRFGLKRQVIEKGDPNASPPTQDVHETDESLLLRYAIAPFSLSTTGTQTGYKYHMMTVGEKPLISVESPRENVVVVTYEFAPTDGIERPKDAEARMIEPNSGKVEGRILSRDGNGTANQALCDSVLTYISRPDIAQATDELSVKSADILEYRIKMSVKEVSKPNQLVDRVGLNNALQDYANQQHRLSGKIQRSRLDQIAHNFNASGLVITYPAMDVICEWYQAPFCTGIETDVRPEEY